MLPKRLLFLSAAVLGCLYATAGSPTPCLIFSGEAGEGYSVELSKYNRISFGPDGMLLTHSSGDSPELSILYSNYHKFSLGDAMPTGIDPVEATCRSLRYDAAAACLRLVCDDSDALFNVGIFNPQGVMVARARMRSGDTMPAGNLSPGVYIAIAVNDNYSMNLKFAK